MQPARLLKRVPDSMDKASGMLGSSPTLNDTNCIFTVREYVDTEPRGHSATGGQGPKVCCELAYRCSGHTAGEAMNPSSFPNRL